LKYRIWILDCLTRQFPELWLLKVLYIEIIDVRGILSRKKLTNSNQIFFLYWIVISCFLYDLRLHDHLRLLCRGPFIILVEQVAIMAEDRCAQMANAFPPTLRGTLFSILVRADHKSDSFCLPRNGRGSDKSVSVIVVLGWLQRSSVRGGAGVARFARSNWIWAGIIPQETRETTGSLAIVGFARFSDRFSVKGRWKMDAITLVPTTRLYDIVKFCYLCIATSILLIMQLCCIVNPILIFASRQW